MGNQLCCVETNQAEVEHHVTVVHKKEPIKIPELSLPIINVLENQKPFEKQLSTNPTVKQYDNDIYQGVIDELGRPHGYGKMYHKNGSLFIGAFDEGVANGPGFYIKPDGSYYQGAMNGNKAEDSNGHYYSKSYEYRGGIEDNAPHGQGTQNGPNHEYNGSYVKGKKTKGTLKWKQGGSQYIYIGEFDNSGLFHGDGELHQPKGKYVGGFKRGIKDGKGQFVFKSGLKYEGQYKENKKQGLGKAVNKNGTVAYEGEFDNNVPHGKGKVQSKDGKFSERVWVQGIDKLYLE